MLHLSCLRVWSESGSSPFPIHLHVLTVSAAGCARGILLGKWRSSPQACRAPRHTALVPGLPVCDSSLHSNPTHTFLVTATIHVHSYCLCVCVPFKWSLRCLRSSVPGACSSSKFFYTATGRKLAACSPKREQMVSEASEVPSSPLAW